MTTARDVMVPTRHLTEDATIAEAVMLLATSSTHAVPVCDSDGRLCGMVTDHDLVVEVAAAGKLSSETRLIDLVRGEVVSVGAEDSIEEVFRTMRDYHTPRVPVVDGDRLVGMVNRAEIAARIPNALYGVADDYVA